MTTVVSTSACQAYGDVAPSTAASSRIPAPSWRLLAPAGTLPQDRQQTAILRHAESGDLFRHDESDDAYAAAKRWPREHRDSLQRTRVGLDAVRRGRPRGNALRQVGAAARAATAPRLTSVVRLD